ncbi:MAG TPA: hypothetical protein VII56_23125 [Rhizomicrobium sp.]
MSDMNFTHGGWDIGEITDEELRRNKDLRARAAGLVAENGDANLVLASDHNVAAPQPKGRKISPAELADAMGAKVIGRSTRA